MAYTSVVIKEAIIHVGSPKIGAPLKNGVVNMSTRKESLKIIIGVYQKVLQVMKCIDYITDYSPSHRTYHIRSISVSFRKSVEWLVYSSSRPFLLILKVCEQCGCVGKKARINEMSP